MFGVRKVLLAQEKEKCGDDREIIIQGVRKAARSLAALSRTNYTRWWKAAEPIFRLEYGEDFENKLEFAPYWKNSAYQDGSEALPNAHGDEGVREFEAFTRKLEMV